MAIRFSVLKESILIVLYDYMLTSDHEGFWFSIPALQEALPPDVPGAFVQRALDALIDEELVEQGGSATLAKDLFALTENGISRSEDLIEERGVTIEDYEPAPESDLILSRFHDPDRHGAVSEAIELLKAEIVKSNSFDETLSGNGDLVEGELDAAATLMSAQRVRVSKLKALLLPALKLLAKTFSTQAIGELAKQLIALIIGLDS